MEVSIATFIEELEKCFEFIFIHGDDKLVLERNGMGWIGTLVLIRLLNSSLEMVPYLSVSIEVNISKRSWLCLFM